MSDIKISVIISTYNQVDYIETCIRSVLDQKTVFPYEVIIHDDASNDGTAEIVRRYGDMYPDKVIAIVEEENQYQKPFYGDLLKNEFAHVRGKYVAFVDGDDFYCDNNKLQVQYEALEAHPECGICVSNNKVVNESNTETISECYPGKEVFLKLSEGIVKRELIAEKIFKESILFPFSTISILCRYEVAVYCEKYKPDMTGDSLIFYAALAYGDFYYINKVMGGYRYHAKGSFNLIGVSRSVGNDKETVIVQRAKLWVDLMHKSGGRIDLLQECKQFLPLEYIYGILSLQEYKCYCDYAHISSNRLLMNLPLKFQIAFFLRKKMPRCLKTLNRLFNK